MCFTSPLMLVLQGFGRSFSSLKLSFHDLSRGR
jgi:hypothetical protein